MKMIIAGGGTGGHVLPAIAIAKALKKIDSNAKVLFIGTELGIEKNLVPKAGFPIEYVKVTGLKGHSIKKQLQALLAIPSAIFRSIQILRREKPDALLGVGGYASGPALLAAFLLRVPSALLEPNSIPGFTNRILAPFVRHIFGAFHKTAHYFPKKRFSVVGSPMNDSFQLLKDQLQRPKKPFRLLVLGGSLGAKALNNTLPKTVALLKDHGINMQITHQTGQNDIEKVKKAYETLGFMVDVRPFIDNMAEVYQTTNLIVCRSGAGTCAEITAMGIPAILVPFPHAIYDHQTENAIELTNANCAVLMPQNQMTPESLSETILELIKNPKRLESMSQNAFKIAKTSAAEEIAKAACNLFQPI